MPRQRMRFAGAVGGAKDGAKYNYAPAPRAIIILPRLPEQKHDEENRDLVAAAR